MILLASIFLILFEAIPEALALRGYKTIAGIIEFVYRAVITLIIFAWLMGILNQSYGENYYYVIGGYLLLRFAMFDAVYNLTAGLPLFFIGSTKLSDKLWQKFFAWSHFPVGGFMGMLKLVSLCIGLTWLMNWQYV